MERIRWTVWLRRVEFCRRKIPRRRTSSKNRLAISKSLFPVAGKIPPIAAPKTLPESLELEDEAGVESPPLGVSPFPPTGGEDGVGVAVGAGEAVGQGQFLISTNPELM